MAITTTHQLIGDLVAQAPFLKGLSLREHIPDYDFSEDMHLYSFANDAPTRRLVARVLAKLAKEDRINKRDVIPVISKLMSVRGFYGTYCQMMAYSWLQTNDVDFNAEVWLGSENLINDNDVALDGRFNATGAIFEVKALGIQNKLKSDFVEKLEQFFPAHIILVDGRDDASFSDIADKALSKTAEIAAELKRKDSLIIEGLGWRVRKEKLGKKLYTTTSEFDPYLFAEQNKLFAYRHCSQFVITRPFVLTCVYSSDFGTSFLTTNFGGLRDVALRALARRTFIEFSENAEDVHKYDHKAGSGFTMGDACHALSALLFIEAKSFDASLYLNPNAANPLALSDIEKIFGAPLPSEMFHLDDFRHDNY